MVEISLSGSGEGPERIDSDSLGPTRQLPKPVQFEGRRPCGGRGLGSSGRGAREASELRLRRCDVLARQGALALRVPNSRAAMPAPLSSAAPRSHPLPRG